MDNLPYNNKKSNDFTTSENNLTGQNDFIISQQRHQLFKDMVFRQFQKQSPNKFQPLNEIRSERSLFINNQTNESLSNL